MKYQETGSSSNLSSHSESLSFFLDGFSASPNSSSEPDAAKVFFPLLVSCCDKTCPFSSARRSENFPAISISPMARLPGAHKKNTLFFGHRSRQSKPVFFPPLLRRMDVRSGVPPFCSTAGLVFCGATSLVSVEETLPDVLVKENVSFRSSSVSEWLPSLDRHQFRFGMAVRPTSRTAGILQGCFEGIDGVLCKILSPPSSRVCRHVGFLRALSTLSSKILS